MEDQKIMFLCDGRVEECPKCDCYRTGGSCSHTPSPEHAVNFFSRKNGMYWELPETFHRKDLSKYDLIDSDMGILI